MGSFFGNIQNAGRTQLKFDKVYPNRKAMETALQAGDGVFIDRFVLVEYDDNTNSRRYGYITEEDKKNLDSCRLYVDSTKTIPYRFKESDPSGYGVFPNDIFYTEIGIKTYYFRCLEESAENGDALFAQIQSNKRDEKVLDYSLNYNIDKDNYPNEMPKDGYDATVWRKILKNGQEAYQLIANLNTRLPLFDIAEDAPSIEPVAPHFGENSTNDNYTLHLQSNWGMKIKPAETVDGKIISDTNVKYDYNYYDTNTNTITVKKEEYPGAIYYNKSGFNSTFNNYTDKILDSEISLLPTGKSGKEYYNHSRSGSSLQQEHDIQELKIYLPEIGNAVASMWNLIYGAGEELNDGSLRRNQDINWGSVSGERLVDIDPAGNGFSYSTEKVETLAGCINSVHDLMGMIIINNNKQNIETALPDKIYYGPFGENGKKGYYFKDLAYTLTPFSKAEQDTFFQNGVKKIYHDLVQFTPNTYYTELNGSFYKEISSVPSADVSYFRLGPGEHIKELKQWQPINPDDETILYSYYMNDKLDYIRDKNESPDISKIYYSILSNPVTNPDPAEGQTKILLWEPKDLILTNIIPDGLIDEDDLNAMKITKIGSGYFYYDEDKKALTAINKDATFNSAYKYYYIPQFALGEGTDLSGATTEILYFIDKNGQLISSVQAAANSEILNKYYIQFLELLDNTYYYEFFDENPQPAEGFKCLHPNKDGTWPIDNSKIYYIIEQEEETDDDSKYYEPGLYYIRTENGDFLLSTSLNFIDDPNIKYYRLTDKNNNIIEKNKKTGDLLTRVIDKANLNPNTQYWIFQNGEFQILDRALSNKELIDPKFLVYEAFKAENILFYTPNKYYYNNIHYKKDIIDSSFEMKTNTHPDVGETDARGRVYFTMNWAYVIEDPQGILSPGSIWDKNVPPPSDVVLGQIIQTSAWKELTGFARTLNTIHGLILHINKMFKFNDKITRDTTTIQGALNKINDILNTFSSFNPQETIIVNDYGNFIGIDAGMLPLRKYNNTDTFDNLNIQIKVDDENVEYDTINSAFLKLEKRILELEEKINILEGK